MKIVARVLCSVLGGVFVGEWVYLCHGSHYGEVIGTMVFCVMMYIFFIGDT